MLLNRSSAQAFSSEDEDSGRFLCLFVIDGSGKRIGESIGIDGDILIIKSNSRFLGVPMKHIEEKDDLLIVKGLVDLKKAYELGEQWQNNSFHKVLDGADNEEPKS
jgi:hypothetical protein